MTLIFCLNHILTEFRPLFNKPNFNLFCAFITGFIAHRRRTTVTGLYSHSSSSSRYWSMVKFLSRGKWNPDAVAKCLLKMLQALFTDWAYVYDETKAQKTGKSQWGLHFFRNHRYRKRNTNQSKFHWGHQFGALGLLCQNATQTLLFPIWGRLIVPRTTRDNSLAVLRKILCRIPGGLIIFDRGFNRRKVFELLVGLKHHLLCRAKGNAVFYHLPKLPKTRKRGRPKRYGLRLNKSRMRYTKCTIDDKELSIASEVVRTKVCPVDVRLVVIRTKPKKSKPYRYFWVYTSDLTLSIERIVRYYRQRWTIETAFRDSKQHFGFDEYQVKSKRSINRFVQLSFVASSITQLLFFHPKSVENQVSLKEILDALGIHWYRPTQLTRGLMIAYLQLLIGHQAFSARKANLQNTPEIDPLLETAA